MKVLIVGANGGIGRILSKKLEEEVGKSPIAMIRKEDQKSFFNDIGVETLMGDLDDSIDNLAEVFDGVDAVVFTAGSGGKTGYDKTLEIDLDAAVKCIEAAKIKGIKRFIIVSVINVDNRKMWNSSSMKPYLIAKYYADHYLKNSELDYTIIRPGSLTDDSGKGTITIEPESASITEISREDVASAITTSLNNESTIGKTFDIVYGDMPIEDAIK